MTPTSVYAVCRVTGVGPRLRLTPGEGNLDPTGPHLPAGWISTLRYTSLGGATHISSVTEVAEWVQTLAPSDFSPTPLVPNHSPPPPSPTTTSTRPQPRHISPPPVAPPTPSPPTSPIVSSLPQLRRSPRLRPLAASASALLTPPPVYYPAPSDLNLDGAGKPLTFSSAIRGPHGKEWGLGTNWSSSCSWSPSSAYFPSSAPPRPPPILRE